MCLNCGCNRAHDDHGNVQNITYEDLAAAAKLDGTSVSDLVKALNKTVVADRTKHESEYETKL